MQPETTLLRPRVSRLAARPCSGCGHHSLVSNGAFWKCDTCGFAVASRALVKDLETSPACVPASGRPSAPRVVVSSRTATIWDDLKAWLKMLAKPGAPGKYDIAKGES
jgi:hypothetical protein